MVSLYVTSIERSAGKDLITMGLIDRLKRDGFKIGYFKPFGHFPYQLGDIITDKGARFIHKLFEMDDPIESICPVMITPELKKQNYEKPITGLREKIEKAFEIVSDKKDVVIIHCDYNFSEGSSFGLSGSVLVELLNAHTLFVEKYTCDFCIDFLLELKRVIGAPLIGVVFNKVEDAHIAEIKDFVSFFLQRNGMRVFGCLPTDSLLRTVEVSELAHILGADVVCCKDNIGALVGSFLVGGMHVDKFITYMIKYPSSAVIVGGDRTDIQLVAIESGARCLILTGNLYPNETIKTRARANGVPILVAKSDTFTVAKGVEAVVGKLSLQDKLKVIHGMKLVDKGFSFEKLYDTLNLAVKQAK